MTEQRTEYPEQQDLHYWFERATELCAEVKRLRSLLETEQRARWGAEQNAQHYQEEAEALRLQVAQLEMLTLQLEAGGMEER